MEAEAATHGGALLKVGVFMLVQALVYLILAQSSTVFSRTRTKSPGLRPASSLGARRMLALLSDVAVSVEPSPVAAAAAIAPGMMWPGHADDGKEDWSRPFAVIDMD